MLGTLMSVIGSPSNLSVLAAWPSLMSLIHRSIIRRNRRVMAYVTPPSILSCDSCPLLFFFFPRSSTRVAYWGVYSLSSMVEYERNFEIGYLGTLAGNFLWNSCNYAVQEFLNGQTWLGDFFFRENISILQELLASLKDLVSIREFASVFCCSA